MAPPSDSFVSLGARSFLATLDTQARQGQGVPGGGVPGAVTPAHTPSPAAVFWPSHSRSSMNSGSTAPETMHSLNLQDQSRKASHVALSSSLLPVLPCLPKSPGCAPRERAWGAPASLPAAIWEVVWSDSTEQIWERKTCDHWGWSVCFYMVSDF